MGPTSPKNYCSSPFFIHLPRPSTAFVSFSIAHVTGTAAAFRCSLKVYAAIAATDRAPTTQLCFMLPQGVTNALHDLTFAWFAAIEAGSSSRISSFLRENLPRHLQTRLSAPNSQMVERRYRRRQKVCVARCFVSAIGTSSMCGEPSYRGCRTTVVCDLATDGK